MAYSDNRWQRWLKNLGWFLATIIVLAVLMRLFRSPLILAVIWGVGLVWGAMLTYQISQLLFGPREIVVSEARLQDYLAQTQAYKRKIDQTITATESAARRVPLESLAGRIEQWTTAIERLVQRLNSLRQDEIIRQDLQAVPKAIADLEKRLAQESDPTLRDQLQRTLTNRRKQAAALAELQTVLRQAEFQIESTLSMLGTIYSQLLTGQSTSDIATYSRLSTDVDEEVRRLEDQLEALREVKLG
jgi:chromosome segregation ATPase